MSYELDLANRKREYMHVTLDDGKETKLTIKEPKKSLVGRIDAAYNIDGEANGDDALNTLYGVTTDILNNNVEEIKLKQKDVEDCMSSSECWAVINLYQKFTLEQVTALSKN